MCIKDCYISIKQKMNHLQSISLLAARLIVAYGFWTPAWKKFGNIDAVAAWFATLGIPFPLINAYLSASTELLGVILLTLGFMTRFISIPLIVIMIVAILTVHLPNGFHAADNGFEIPLYYMIFLSLFLSFGAGKISVDHFVFKKQ
ncbi:HvfX family Cu-binding RiPP maturation protein [Sulfurospirillum sp. 1612]|uniref:HvfX family Cu-binding RiPP maturation protein n=1 Tax=Sulfurospirillum sp. 1612 TaxID=3094835 RepID=UPI002F95EB0A